MKKNYSINVPAGFFWRIVLPAAMLTIMFGGVTGIVIIDKIIMPRITALHDKGIITIPNLINMEKDKAREYLYNVGLRLQIQGHEYNDSITKDIIILQQPAPDQEVKRGRHIFVTLSKGREIDTIPEITNIKERIGKRTLYKGGFSNIVTKKVFSNSIAKDYVVATNPKKGMIISREIPVEVYISKGPKPTHTVVPNIIGEALSDAKKAISENNLILGTVKIKQTSSGRLGVVLSQSLSPGAHVHLESKVNIIVSGKR